MKRFALALLATLCLIASAADAATRRPRVLIVVNDIYANVSSAANEKYTKAAFQAYGFETFVVHGPHMRPLLWYSTGYGTDLGVPKFDALAIISSSYFWSTDFQAVRWDSMCRVSKYNTIPAIFVESRFGFGQACSTGVDLTDNTGQYFDTNTQQTVGRPGTNLQFRTDGPRGQNVPNSSQSGAPVTRLLMAGGDTTFVWKRRAGAGQTFVVTSAGFDEIACQLPMILTGVSQIYADLPDSVKTKPFFRWGSIMDEGFMRNRTSASVSYEDMFTVPTTTARPGIRAYADSIRRRQIKLTLSGDFNPDTCEVVEANGITRIQNEINLWQADSDPNFKWYIHNHTGYDTGSRLPVGGGNASAASRRFWDTYGGTRNRECDPLSASDSSIYALNYGALQYARSKVGWNKVTRLAGPPSGDYSPRNLLTSTCRLDDLYASLARAGYNSLVATGNLNTCGHGKVINSASSNGYECAPRTVDTSYGSLRIMYLNPTGGSPLGSDSTFLSAQNRTNALRYNLAHYFVGGLPNSFVGFFSPVLTGHLRTLTGGASFWIILRDMDDFFEMQNQIVGYPMYDWAFCDELPATPPWNQ